MKNISIYLISPNSTIKEAARYIDLNEAQIALVVDKDRRLLGTVTDGDRKSFIEPNWNRK